VQCNLGDLRVQQGAGCELLLRKWPIGATEMQDPFAFTCGKYVLGAIALLNGGKAPGTGLFVQRRYVAPQQPYPAHPRQVAAFLAHDLLPRAVRSLYIPSHLNPTSALGLQPKHTNFRGA